MSPLKSSKTTDYFYKVTKSDKISIYICVREKRKKKKYIINIYIKNIGQKMSLLSLLSQATKYTYWSVVIILIVKMDLASQIGKMKHKT